MTAPANHVFEITPDDDTDLERTTNALRAFVDPQDGLASIVVVTEKGEELTLYFGPGVTVDPIKVRRVKESGASGTIILHGYA